MKLLAQVPKAKALYEALGVRETASTEEIRKAFWRVAKSHHPDMRGGEQDPIYIAAAHAYDVLSDPARRAQYDLDGIDHGETTEGLQRAAVQIIVKLAFGVIADGGEESDIVAAVKRALGRAHDEHSMTLRRIENAIAKAEKARANIERRWSGAEAAKAAVLAMICEQSAKDDQAKAAEQQSLQLLDIAIGILKAAKYQMPASMDLNMFAMISGLDQSCRWVIR